MSEMFLSGQFKEAVQCLKYLEEYKIDGYFLNYAVAAANVQDYKLAKRFFEVSLKS